MPDRSVSPQREPSDHPSVGAMLGEVIDITAGLGIILLPLFAIALPGVILLLILPAVLLLGAVVLPIELAGALLAPPYLLVRRVRRRRAG